MVPIVKTCWLVWLLISTLISTIDAAVVSTRFGLLSKDINDDVLITHHASTKLVDAQDGTINRVFFEGVRHGSVTTTKTDPIVNTSCSQVYRRQEWRRMQLADRFAYIRGVQCLQNLSSIANITGSRSRFDDFQGLHAQLMDEIHLVGHFLPWHRWFMTIFESTMREACNYEGAQPYWDWSLDVDNFPESPLFDPITGFGSIGLNGRSPVKDGPFSTYKLIFGTGPPPNITEHTIERGFNSTMLQYITQTEVDRILSQTTFERFRIELEGRHVTPTPRLHDGGHLLVGGDLADSWSSPGDPLFYLHHANLDRIWWEWQKSSAGRLYEISGRQSTDALPAIEVTLDFMLSMGSEFGKSTSIRKVMDIEHSLCYTYI